MMEIVSTYRILSWHSGCERRVVSCVPWCQMQDIKLHCCLEKPVANLKTHYNFIFQPQSLSLGRYVTLVALSSRSSIPKRKSPQPSSPAVPKFQTLLSTVYRLQSKVRFIQLIFCLAGTPRNRKWASPRQPEVVGLGHESLRFLEVFRQNEFLVPEKVEDVAKKNSVAIDEEFALVEKKLEII